MKSKISSEQNFEEKKNKKLISAQVLAVLVNIIITTNLSAMSSSITIVNGVLKESTIPISTNSTPRSENNFVITTAQASFYGTLHLITHLIAGIFSGIFQDTHGRKMCMMVAVFPQIASWITLYYSKNIHWLYLHSILIGSSTAFSEVAIITYISEVSSVKLRGQWFSLGKIGYGLGSFVVFFMSNFLNWRTLAITSTLMPVVMMFHVAWLPESPLWLLSKGREEDCKESLKWLNGLTTEHETQQDLAKLQIYINESQNLGKSEDPDITILLTRHTVFQKLYHNYIKLFFLPEFLMPFKIISVLFTSSYFLSLKPARPYLINTLDTLGVNIDKMKIMTVSSIAQITGSITLAFTVKRFGKRQITLWTFTSCAICLAFAALYSYFHFHHNFKAVWIVYILYGLIFYFTGYTLGGMPWFYCAEIFPQKIRGVSGGLSGTFAYIIITILTQSYFFLETTITLTNVFLLYSVLSLLSCYYLKLYLPETENKSLQEIEEQFKSKKNTSELEFTSIQ